jgi:hypothetical protein
MTVGAVLPTRAVFTKRSQVLERAILGAGQEIIGMEEYDEFGSVGKTRKKRTHFMA